MYWTRKAKWGALSLGIAVLTVAGIAWGANRKVHPSYSVIVSHSLGQIVKTNTGLGDPKWVKADVVVEHTCPSGQYLADMSLLTPHQGELRYFPTKTGKRTLKAPYASVRLATVAQVEKACGSGDELEVTFDLTGIPADTPIELVSAGYYDRIEH